MNNKKTFFLNLYKEKLEEIPRAIGGKAPFETLEKKCEELAYLKEICEHLNIGDVSHSCICCGKEIKKLDGQPKGKDWECMWSGGIVEKISAGYGSLLDGDMYVLAICDDCVKLKQLKYVGNYMFPDNCV
jgi:hypothetical protein